MDSASVRCSAAAMAPHRTIAARAIADLPIGAFRDATGFMSA